MHEFSIKELLQELRNKIDKIILSTLIATIIGFVIAFSIPNHYASQVKLAPELSESNMLDGMGELASLVGLNMSMINEAITPELYPNVVATNTFLVNLLPIKVTTKNGDSSTFQNYMTSYTELPWWGYGKLWILKQLKETKSGEKIREVINPKELTKEEEYLIKKLRGCINCDIDDDNGVIKIKVLTQDPLVSAQIVDSVTSNLQKFITDYRTNKAKIDAKYFREIEDSLSRKYQNIQNDYATFCDTHHDLVLESYLTKKESLENELNMAYEAYSRVRLQVVNSEAKVQERSPAFTVLEEACVANKPESPYKVLIVFACFFIGLFGSIGKCYYKLLFSRQ